MSEEDKHINYAAADIDKYHRGELSASEMHAMEKAALEDPFLADAMEGYEVQSSKFKVQGSASAVISDINDLRKRLAERVTEKKTARVIQFAWWKVAAVVFLFMGAAWFYITINSKAKMESLVKNDEIKPAPSPAAKSNIKDSSRIADTISAAGDLVVAEKKPTTRNKNMEPRYKIKDAASDSMSVAAISPLQASGDAEQERVELKTNAAVEKGNAKSFETYDTARQPLASSRATDNQGFIADARKKERLAPAVQYQKTAGIATNDDKSAINALGGRANHTSNTFNGTILDASNNPLANATIQIPNLNIATVTDKKGFFSFKAPDTALSVSVASVGFETQNLDLTTNSIDNASNVIRLKPSLLNLNEVVVTGYGTQKKLDLKKTKDVTLHILDAEPSVEWSEYNSYLEKNKKIPEAVKNIHGSVVVSFTVDNKGGLKNFKIEKPLNEQLDAEAIRLVKEGPSWRLLKGRKAKASVIVKF